MREEEILNKYQPLWRTDLSWMSCRQKRVAERISRWTVGGYRLYDPIKPIHRIKKHLL